MNPPVDSIFRWSCFSATHPFCNATEELCGSEYKSAKEAGEKIVMEDGEIAWDLGHSGHPGPPMQKKIFGLYGKYNKGWNLTGGAWDVTRKDLIGCVTIKDWEWDRYADCEEEFTDENVLSRLEEEIDVWLG